MEVIRFRCLATIDFATERFYAKLTMNSSPVFKCTEIQIECKTMQTLIGLRLSVYSANKSDSSLSARIGYI